MRFLLPLLLLLAGCSAVPTHLPPPGALFELEGRIAVNYDDQGYYGNLHWIHYENSDEIQIFSPLGQTLADIVKSPAAAVLTTGDQKRYSAPDVEQLTQKVLGWSLPLKGLHHWVRATPIPEEASRLEMGDDGRPKTLLQDNWKIDYPRYYPETGLPREIRMQYPTLQIKLLVDNWVKS